MKMTFLLAIAISTRFLYGQVPCDNFTIKYEKDVDDVFQLAIYDEHSKLIFSREMIQDDKIEIQSQSLSPGVYFYKLTND